jgi:hypothetical protein
MTTSSITKPSKSTGIKGSRHELTIGRTEQPPTLGGRVELIGSGVRATMVGGVTTNQMKYVGICHYERL